MDMELDVETILNLDGGGSTTLHTLTEEGKLQQYICETPIEREVADAIAIVKKK
jgi:exopolysaccharide biosynthesis protein